MNDWQECLPLLPWSERLDTLTNAMWNLDDNKLYLPFIRIEVPRVFTWGSQDRSKREIIREAASRVFPTTKSPVDVWAFRILFGGPTSLKSIIYPKLSWMPFAAGKSNKTIRNMVLLGYMRMTRQGASRWFRLREYKKLGTPSRLSRSSDAGTVRVAS
jgi:hypothetical protein